MLEGEIEHGVNIVVFMLFDISKAGVNASEENSKRA